ncbi:MAG: phenylacetic acid degradation protein [Anaerolineae bacterium]|nr:phenylacetic acid degradation protein [Anaerolineae bacterium]
MMDTQWPRYIVFHQEKIDALHQYAGSVHAADAQMALMNARDVFVRRPKCVSLWVVPANAVLTRTAEEGHLDTQSIDPPNPMVEMYHIFQKTTHQGTLFYAGDVEAASGILALASAQVQFPSGKVWWVCPARRVTRSTPEDIEVLFAPAQTKTYRDQAIFHTVSALQKIKTRTQEIVIDES